MFELSLFPLNTVLFPGMPLRLHIFEERYKAMFRTCISERQPFGVALIRNGSEAHGPLADPYSIGCSARILEVESLDEGRLNVLALGQHRFRILSLNYDKPYLTGLVENYPLEDGDQDALGEAGNRLLPWVRRYMRMLDQYTDSRLEPEKLPADPLVLAYLGAVLLQVPPSQKQELLVARSGVDFIDRMIAIYRREVALLDSIINMEMGDTDGRFRAN